MRDLAARLAGGEPGERFLDAALAAAIEIAGARAAALRIEGAAAPAAARGDVSRCGAVRLAVPLPGPGPAGRLEIWPAGPLPRPFAERGNGRARPRLPLPAARWRALETIAALASLALDRSRPEGTAERARAEERARLGREVHDGAAQAIGAAKLEIERIALGRPEDAPALEPVIDRLAGALADLRAVARGLPPPALEALGLAGALRRLAEDLERRSPGLRATCAERGAAGRLGRDVEWHLYRIAEEAVANVARHARARRASIELDLAPDGGARLVVEDDGRGLGPGAANGGGMGLETMRERARSLGGRFSATPRPAGGTRVEVALPPAAAAGRRREGP